jgi:hypothetical protein
MPNSDGAAKGPKFSVKVVTVPLREPLILRYQRLEPMAGIGHFSMRLRSNSAGFSELIKLTRALLTDTFLNPLVSTLVSGVKSKSIQVHEASSAFRFP